MWPFDVELGPKWKKFEYCVLPFWYCVVILWVGLLSFWGYLMVDDIRATSRFETAGKLVGLWDIPFPAVTVCSKWNLSETANKPRDSTSNMKNPNTTKNENWDVNQGYKMSKVREIEIRPARSNINGKRGGLEVYLASYGTYKNTFCNITPPEFKVMIHNPAEVPYPERDHIPVSPQQEVTLDIRPFRVSISEELRSRPKLRDCYFSDEKRLAFFNVYTQRNCQLECVVNKTMEACGCPQYFDIPCKNPCPEAKDPHLLWKVVDQTPYLSGEKCDCKRDCGIDKYRLQAAVATFDTPSFVASQKNKSFDGRTISKLMVYVNSDHIYVDDHHFLIIHHPMAGWGDFLFILTGLSFLMSFTIALLLVRPDKTRRRSMDSPLLGEIE
ncbi:hypothetical protein AAG570_003645 [Ranatra chinensis]|uniref:Sodium channel protein Nach n=1 Tax=Ranatra chinensis TaxID=642074 RepID=A0ABD0Y4A5_9HEMI